MAKKTKNILSIFLTFEWMLLLGIVLFIGGSIAFADYREGAWVDEELFVDANGNVASEDPSKATALVATAWMSREDKNITIENITIENCNAQDWMITGLTIKNAKGIRIRNVEIDFSACSGSTPRYGIYLDNGEIEEITNVTIKGAWRGIFSEEDSLIHTIDGVSISNTSANVALSKAGIYNLDSEIGVINNVTVDSNAYLGIYNKGSSSKINKIENTALNPKATFQTTYKSVGLSNSGVIGTVSCSNTITGNYLPIENHHGGTISNNPCNF